MLNIHTHNCSSTQQQIVTSSERVRSATLYTSAAPQDLASESLFATASAIKGGPHSGTKPVQLLLFFLEGLPIKLTAL